MRHGHDNNCKTNRLHERCLRIICSDKKSSYEALLEKGGFVSIHNRNLQIPATEMCKARKGLSPPVMMKLFKARNKQNYNLLNNAEFSISVIGIVYHGSESISFLDPKMLNALPNRLKNVNNLETFKSKIKKWKPENFPYRLCRLYK